MATAIIYDPVFYTHETGLHPESSRRLTSIEAAFERRQTRAGAQSLAPRAATRVDLERVHAPAMLDQIEAACGRGDPCLDPDTVICAGSLEAALKAAGGALAGIDALMSGTAANAFLLARPPGHHATPGRAMGFCLFNSVAVAARYAQATYGIERVLILDWDVHHGNGTQDAFYTDPSVYYVSLHQMPLYPGTGHASEEGEGRGRGFTRNVPMRPFTPAASYLEAFHHTLEAVAREFRPELVLVSAGFDSHAQDPLGSLLLQDAHFREMTMAALDIAHRYAGGRLLSLLEGGYNLEVLGDTVATHVEALKEG